MQTEHNQETAKHGIIYFIKDTCRVLKGRFWGLLAVILLLAVPAAVVTAYTTGRSLNNIMELAPQFNLATETGMQEFLTALQDISASASTADIALDIIVQLLICSVTVTAALVTYAALNNDTTLDKDKAVLAPILLRKSPWLMLIRVFSGMLLNMLLTYISTAVLLLPALFGGARLIGMIVTGIVFVLITLLVQAFITMYSANMSIAVALNRTRLSISATYIGILLKGKYKRGLKVYFVSEGVRSLLQGLLLSGGVLLFSPSGTKGLIALFVCYLIITVADGLINCFYTSYYFELEQTGQERLKKMQEEMMQRYEQAMREAGRTPDRPFDRPSANEESDSEQSPQEQPDGEQPTDGQASDEQDKEI